ncbi:MAG: efflux RND transporter periplasmic adaptor subunit [Bermanella sp.]
MRLQRGHCLALAATVILSIWMASGKMNKAAQPHSVAVVANPQSDIFSVQVTRFHAQTVTPELVIHGQTAPNRRVDLSSELTGRVIRIHRREGDFVEKGQLIMEIDPQDKPHRLLMAQAQLKQRTLEHKANQNLIKKGLQNETRLAHSDALLAAAKAQVKLLQVQLAATKVRAPFAGVLEDRKVEVGTFLKSGNGIISLLDFDPFIIKGYAAEKDLLRLKTGTQARGRTLDGQEHLGVIRYIASQASAASRTFAIELQIDNPSGRHSDGATADLIVPMAATAAIFISPALLGLDEHGTIGAKYVDRHQQVVFAPVVMVKAESKGVWVAGLPNPVDLIVVGQSFVSPGERVHPVFSEPAPDNREPAQQNSRSRQLPVASHGGK